MAPYQYILKERIGGGGFADVYRAIRSDTRMEVAVKMLREYRDPDARHRFAREVKLLRGYGHRSIIRMLDANEHAPRPFYVMPLMKGGCLTKWAGRLLPELVRAVIHELAFVLVHLHKNGAIHRDLKPDNILVDALGHFAVGDFGLGNDPRFTVMFTAHAQGTWGYIAPELIEGWGTASAASDIYSLGATAFHLLTGIHPKDVRYLDPGLYNAHIPHELRTSVLWMVHRDPAQRPTANTVLTWLGARRFGRVA